MSRLYIKLSFVFLGMLIAAGSLMAQANQTPTSEPPKHEFRSVWLTTAFGLDFPGTVTGASNQQALLRQFVERAYEMRMNAIVFQVVSRGDAQYQSERLPWARRLAGTLGEDPGWDPLQFVIDESKKYGIEVHAWYNVFNVGVATDINEYVSSDLPHVYATNPEWIQNFDGSLWMNPAIPEAREWQVANVMEIVENYDVDAVHFDFARYPSQDGFTGDFQRYQDSDFTGSFDNWRRNNVNQFQRDVYAAVQEVKPWVKVGTTPVGHHRRNSYSSLPAEPCPIAYQQEPWHLGNFCQWGAFMGYSQVYQDALTWINEGVNDYIAPQIYWAIGPPGPHFEFLTRDWARLARDSGKHVYIGIGPYQNTPGTNVAAETAIQVDTVRVYNHAGHLFFRFAHIYGNMGAPTFQTASRINYIHRSLVPTMDWKDTDAPDPVMISKEAPAMASTQSNSVTLTWDAPDFTAASGDTKVSYAIYRVNAFDPPDPTSAMDDPANLIALTGNTGYTDNPPNLSNDEAKQNYYYFVTPYSRNWVEGEPSNVVEYLTPTSIDSGDMIAKSYELAQNYPNPFNPTTQIRYTLGESGHASLIVYDAVGREVATLVSGVMPVGVHTVTFDASNLSSGLYIYVLRAGGFTKTQKMMLLK
jgi:uncharacterized lipoprotein YddW (UPF0748 family)